MQNAKQPKAIKPQQLITINVPEPGETRARKIVTRSRVRATGSLISQTRDQILSIEYPQDGKLRARKVISRSKARPTGKYPSWKMDRMVHWESPHELNAYRLLDADRKSVV